MGRPRTTGCTARHRPGEPCLICARVRARRWRRSPVGRAATSADEPSPWRAAHARARAYVHAYRRRGAIVLPEACDRCGLGLRLTVYKPVTPLYAWHPDPARPREVAWLCRSCRTIVRASRETLELSWTWPGAPIAPRRSPAILPEWIAAADVRAQALAWASAAAQDDAWVSGLVSAAAIVLNDLYAVGVRRGEHWTPTGDARADLLLRRWVRDERRRRAELAEPRFVEPVPVPPRRRNRTGSASSPVDEAEPSIRAPFDAAAHERRAAEALFGLARAEALVDATNARVEAALRRLTGRG